MVERNMVDSVGNRPFMSNGREQPDLPADRFVSDD
jgi:hypothetical protein